MKLSTIKTVFLGLVLLFFQFGCGHQQIDVEHTYRFSKTFAKEYDEVWKALENLMVEELRYPIKIKDKGRGIIETDWISIIRIRGTLRWNVKVLLDRKDDGIVVRVYDRVEEPSEVRGKLKSKSGEVKTGWEVSDEKVTDVDNILRMLSTRLEK